MLLVLGVGGVARVTVKHPVTQRTVPTIEKYPAPRGYSEELEHGALAQHQPSWDSVGSRLWCFLKKRSSGDANVGWDS